MASNLILDLDGTLIDDSERHWRVFRKLTGLKIGKKEYWEKRRSGLSNHDLAKAMPGNVQFSGDEFKQVIETTPFLKWDKLIVNMDTMSMLSEQFTLVLCTVRSNRALCMMQLRDLGLLPFFRFIIIIPHVYLISKKSKAPFIPEHIDIQSGDQIVGDTEIDIITGKDLSIKTVAVTSGIRSREFLSSLHPSRIIESINHFYDI